MLNIELGGSVAKITCLCKVCGYKFDPQSCSHILNIIPEVLLSWNSRTSTKSTARIKQCICNSSYIGTMCTLMSICVSTKESDDDQHCQNVWETCIMSLFSRAANTATKKGEREILRMDNMI